MNVNRRRTPEGEATAFWRGLAYAVALSGLFWLAVFMVAATLNEWWPW